VDLSIPVDVQALDRDFDQALFGFGVQAGVEAGGGSQESQSAVAALRQYTASRSWITAVARDALVEIERRQIFCRVSSRGCGKGRQKAIHRTAQTVAIRIGNKRWGDGGEYVGRPANPTESRNPLANPFYNGTKHKPVG